MSQATLRSERLALVPLSDEHLEYEIELDSDPQVMRFLGSGRARTPDEVQRLHHCRISVARKAPGLGSWVGFVGDEFVGWWSLEPPEQEEPTAITGQAELGYRLLRRHWRRGLASEGARALIRHGFADLGLNSIYAETMAVNEPSRATMRSVGLRYVRTFHLDWQEPIPGSEHGEVVYAITRQQWILSHEQ